jgi:hypothetical protein
VRRFAFLADRLGSARATKGKIMATDRESLLRYRSAALRCNESAQNVLAAFSAKDAFPNQEAETAFRNSWTIELDKAADEWQTAGCITTLANGDHVCETVKIAVGLSATPILVGRFSFLTAHEAVGYYTKYARDYLMGERAELSSIEDLHAQIEGEYLKALNSLEEGEKDKQDGPWSKPDGPIQWAKKFGFSTTTLNRRFKDGKIRYKKLSSKSYCIHVDDVPK